MGRSPDRRANARLAPALRPGVEGLEGRLLLASDSGAAATRARFKVDGAGLAAAVIDTGVNYRHEALGGGYGPGYKVKAGYDFADGHDTPDATTWQHGTAVAGLIASTDPARKGVAPGADIVSLRVFGDDNQGSYARIADALQWVVEHHDEDNITVVNVSISDGGNYSQNLFARDGADGQRVTEQIAALDALNIPVVTAAGNNYAGAQGMGFPAVVADTISVAALDGSNRLAADAQRLGKAGGGPSSTIAAPGTRLVAPVEGDGFATVDGSSFAAAEVSGAILLLQQVYQSRFHALPTVANLTTWLKAGSSPIPGTSASLPGRLDIAKAAALIPRAPSAQVKGAQTVAAPLSPIPASGHLPAPTRTIAARIHTVAAARAARA